jgi:LysR family carnitine catabolism transcriptional activator
MNPSLRQLQAFVLAYHLGVLTRAADKMSITQSAVSVLIRQLEEGLGMRLFDRTSRTLRPTIAAQKILPTAERVLRDLESIKAEVKGLAEREHGHLNFASTPSVAASVLPTIIAAYKQRYPNISVSMQDIAPDRLTVPVLTEEAEFSIGTLGDQPEGIAVQCLVRDYMCAICLKDSSLAKQKLVVWQDILAQPCITVKVSNSIRHLIDETLHQLGGGQLEPAYEVSYFATALSMTAAGLGVAVLPGVLLGSFPHHNLIAKKIERPVVTRDIQLITRAEHSLSPAAKAFVDLWYELLGTPDIARANITIAKKPRARRVSGVSASKK